MLTVFDIHKHPWDHHRNHDSEHICHPKSFLVTLCKCSLMLSPPHPQATTITMDWFQFSRLLYKWNYTVCPFLVWLFLFSILTSRFICIVEYAEQKKPNSNLFQLPLD